MKNKEKCESRASLTVEAAFVLPIFFLAVVMFLYLMQILFFYEHVQSAITKAAEETAKYAAFYEKYHNEPSDAVNNSQTENIRNTIKIMGIPYMRHRVKELLRQEVRDQPFLQGGFNSMNFAKSKFMEEDHTDLIVTYTVRPPINLFGLYRIHLTQRAKVRNFTGYHSNSEGRRQNENLKKDEEIVYITDTGTVYHLTEQCCTLDLSINKVLYKNIDTLRNKSGGKYKKCEICYDSIVDDIKQAYITPTGDRYHCSLNCRGLKRHILEISINQVGQRSRCKRCG